VAHKVSNSVGFTTDIARNGVDPEFGR